MIVKPRPDDQQFAWLVDRRRDARAAGWPTSALRNVWLRRIYSTREYNQTKVFTITDRPVYRPGQTVKFKFWVAHAKYDQPNTSDFANQSFKVELHDPKGEKLLSKDITSDAYGGLEGEFALPPHGDARRLSASRWPITAAAVSASRNTRSRSSK